MTLEEDITYLESKIYNLESNRDYIKTLLNNELKKLEKEIDCKKKSITTLLRNQYKSKTVVKNDRIITSVPIRTVICCGQGGSQYKRIWLSDLLRLWDNGYRYDGYPIYNITTTNSGYKSMTYMKDGKKITINDKDVISQYQEIPYKILGRWYRVD